MTYSQQLRRLPLLLLSIPMLFAPQLSAQENMPVPKPATLAPAPAGAATPQQAAQSAKSQQLISQAEASYKSGVDNYRGNRLEAARLDFDHAVDLLLTSGVDLTTDPALNDEFERLLDNINSLEMAALRQGNGFSPKLDDAPLDTAEDITFAPNPELVARLNSELNVASDLPLVINDQVAGYIGVFSERESFRKHMAASLKRVGKYRGLIQDTLKQEGVPQDLIYLAVAESGFQPQVVNARSGAGGMWQFMPATGTQYGLTRNSYFDYRFDPEKASRAYARYIKALYAQFGDWYLAMAAYNWSAVGVVRDVQKTGFADYWQLLRLGLMPAETRAYVPQILAAVIMAKNPEKYGLDKLVASPAVIYDTVQTDYAIDLRLVADITGSTVAELVELNPAMLRLTTARDIPFDLHIPPGTKDLYNERLKDIPEDRRASWRFHIVKANETLDSIASALHAKPSDIAETNGITAQDPMAVDDELVIPLEAVATAAHPQRYKVRRGDTLVTIADSFNVTTEQLRRWNALPSSALKPGRTINVAEPVRLAVSSRGGGRRSSRGRGRRARAAASTRGASNSRSAAHANAKPHGAHGAATHAATASSHSNVKAQKPAAKHKPRH